MDLYIIVAALRVFRHYRRSIELLLPRAIFSRLVYEVMNDVKPGGMQIQESALDALQEAAGTTLVTVFERRFFFIILIFILN